jgi:hypothetical protein
LDFCIRTSTIMNSATNTWTAVRNPIKIFMRLPSFLRS